MNDLTKKILVKRVVRKILSSQIGDEGFYTERVRFESDAALEGDGVASIIFNLPQESDVRYIVKHPDEDMALQQERRNDPTYKNLGNLGGFVKGEYDSFPSEAFTSNSEISPSCAIDEGKPLEVSDARRISTRKHRRK